MEREWREREVMGRVIEKDGGWKSLAENRDRNQRKQPDMERKLGRNQRVTETERQMTGSRTALSLCLLPPSSPSINFLLQQETLTPSFLLLLGPINNLICCHMIILRPGMRLPSLLNSNE